MEYLPYYYFAYGMNTNSRQMSHRCSGARSLGPAYLHGYRLVFRLHADIEMDECSSVTGVLWQIDEEHLNQLDFIEGFPNYYLRQRVRVVDDKNEKYTAWVYTMEDQSYRHGPQMPYFNLCMEGYAEHGLSTFQLTDAANNIK